MRDWRKRKRARDRWDWLVGYRQLTGSSLLSATSCYRMPSSRDILILLPKDLTDRLFSYLFSLSFFFRKKKEIAFLWSNLLVRSFILALVGMLLRVQSFSILEGLGAASAIFSSIFSKEFHAPTVEPIRRCSWWNGSKKNGRPPLQALLRSDLPRLLLY